MENLKIPNQNQAPPEKVCPKCGKVLNKDWQACPACGWTTKPEQKVSHGMTIASIVCGVIGFFVFGIILGLIGTVLGAQAVKNKDKWGIAGLVLGSVVAIFSIISVIDFVSQLY